MNRFLNFFSLFGSLSTLLCCALPVALVTLGMGASFAALTSAFPQVIWLSEHKLVLFIITGLMLAGSYFLMKRAEQQSCPIDPKKAEACQSGKNYSKWIWGFSVACYLIGFSFSYILPKVLL